jgi:hypothetical protein
MEGTAECRNLHTVDFHDLYGFLDIIWMIKSRMRWVGHVTWVGGREMPAGYWKGSLKEGACLEHLCKWKESIKMDLGEIRWEGLDWLFLAQDGDK